MLSDIRMVMLSTLTAFGILAGALKPDCAPGGNFDLQKWDLQLPVGTSENPGSPRTLRSGELSGCEGWSDPDYFFTSKKDGRLITKVPGSPETARCVTTGHSQHCRTELRESHPNSWSTADSYNRLRVRLAVPEPGEHGSVAIGQVVHNLKPNKPVAEVYYTSDGNIEVGVAQSTAGGDQVRKFIGNIPPGQLFSYDLRFEKDKLSIKIIEERSNKVIDKARVFLDTPLRQLPCYFKVGNYNQGDSPTEVHFYSIDVSHDEWNQPEPVDPQWTDPDEDPQVEEEDE